MGIPGRSRAARFSDRRLIATAGTHFEHKSCAVKSYAYTLDSSTNLASALQQNRLFPQLAGIALFSLPEHDMGSAVVDCLHQPLNHP